MINIHPSWHKHLQGEFLKPYFQDLQKFLETEKNQGKIIYPKSTEIFAAFDNCPFAKVKVIILGQDPYHGASQAHGLSFSVNNDVKLPPSLKNIFKERLTDIHKPIPTNGNLTSWATQGVLLLNATLTVAHKSPGSHQNKGWEIFTDKVIKTISDQHSNVVFLLWGNFARSKRSLIDVQKHCILEAPHPSPFSAHKGFFGCQHFSKTNVYLSEHKKSPIVW